MVKNYFVVAIRYLMRHKLYTFINLFGLGLGLACCLMMALFVKHEWASDGFHQNEDELFRVVKQRLLPNGEAGAFGSIEGANLKDPVIIGIVRDFHTDALYEPIQPVVLQMRQFNNWPAFFVHMRSDQLSDTLDMLKETWKAIVPSGRFQFSFLDRNLHRQYEQEDRWREIVSHSALFSVWVCSDWLRWRLCNARKRSVSAKCWGLPRGIWSGCCRKTLPNCFCSPMPSLGLRPIGS